MDFPEARAIPLSLIVEHLGGRYSHTDRHGDIWYFSVFRPKEKTASFKVSPKLNKWYDHGLSGVMKTDNASKRHNGGDGADLWNDFHHRDRRQGIPQTLIDLEQFIGMVPNRPQSNQCFPNPAEPGPARYKILKAQDKISHQGLRDELYRRRISKRVAEIYLKQGTIRDTVTGKNYTGFLFSNDQGGYEVSIPNPAKGECFKTCIGPKSSTAIQPPGEFTAIDAFEGFWDFLSWLEIRKILFPVNYTFVLNSVSFTGEVAHKIIAFRESVTSVFLFMDNDPAGEAATNELALSLEPEPFKVGDMRQSYASYKDLGKQWEREGKLQLH